MFLLVLLSTSVLGANINGFGSDTFHGGDFPDYSFTIGQDADSFDTTLNDSVDTGIDSHAVACNIDTRDSSNELVTVSGSTVYVYSGDGNTLTLIDSYTVPNTINDYGCLGNQIHVAHDFDNDGYTQLEMDSGTLESAGSSSVGRGLAVSCQYVDTDAETNCLVGFNDSLFVFDNNGTSLFSDGIGFDSADVDNTTYDFTTDDTFQYFNRTHAYVHDSSNNEMLLIDMTDGQEESSQTGIGSIIVFADFGEDGDIEYCFYDSEEGLTSTLDFRCYDETGSNINNKEIYSDPSDVPSYIGGATLKYDGDVYACAYYNKGNGIKQTGCYDPVTDTLTDDLEHINLANYDTDSSFLYQDGTFGVVGANDLYDSTEKKLDFSSDLEDSYISVADITGNSQHEIIFSQNGNTQVFFNGEVQESDTSTITFASNVVNGGFFGYYDGNTCPNTNVTFKAQECIGDLEECNYYNSLDEQERLRIECGDGTEHVGSYANSQPSVTCNYTSTGEYDAVIYIQGENPNNLTNNANDPIPITVDTDNCNEDTYEQPRLTDDDTTDSGNNTAPSTEDDADDTDDGITDTSTKAGALAQNFLDHILLMFAIPIILAPSVVLFSRRINSVFIHAMATVFAALFTATIGMISLVQVIFIIVVTLAIAIIVGLLIRSSPSGAN